MKINFAEKLANMLNSPWLREISNRDKVIVQWLNSIILHDMSQIFNSIPGKRTLNEFKAESLLEDSLEELLNMNKMIIVKF